MPLLCDNDHPILHTIESTQPGTEAVWEHTCPLCIYMYMYLFYVYIISATYNHTYCCLYYYCTSTTLTARSAMAYTPVEKFQYVPFSTSQQPSPDAPPTASNNTPSPLPKPKPRSRNYQKVNIPRDAASELPPPSFKPAVPKKPQNYSSVSRKPPVPLPSDTPAAPGEKGPAPLPDCEEVESLPGSGKPPMALPPAEGITGTVNVKAVAKMLSSQTLPRKMEVEDSEPTPPTHSQHSRRRSDNDLQPLDENSLPPVIPDRINCCFDSSKINAIPTGPRKRVTSVSAATPQDLNWQPTGESMTLFQLADAHSSRFPLKIHLLDGYYGQTARFTLSSSDIFDVHFAKRTQVVSVRDSVGTDYSIPLNSAVEFGIIFQQRMLEEKPPQLSFKTVEELLSLDNLPKVVCATTKWGKPSTKASVEENELLLVKGIYKPPLRNKRALKCYSLKTDTRKLLPEECEGNFSVDPKHTKLHVYEFAVKLKAMLPCRAMMFLCADNLQDSPVFRSVPKSLFKKPISIMKVTTEISLTATSVSIKQNLSADPSADHVDFTGKPIKTALPMEIPLDSHLGDIEVEILKPPNKAETEKLYMNTRELLEKVNKEPYMFLVDKGSDRINDAQSLFYMQIRPEKSDLGVAVETSETIYERMEADGTAATSSASSGTSSASSTAPRRQAKVTIREEDGNLSDSSDEHMYEMIDDEIRRMYPSPALQQLAPSSPHFSPPHQHAFHPASYDPVAFSLAHNHPAFSLPRQSGPFSATAHLLNESYDQYALPTSLPFAQSVPLTPSPFLSPSPALSTSYVHMVPTASVAADTAATRVPPEVKMANQNFLRNMPVAMVSVLLCKLLWAALYLCHTHFPPPTVVPLHFSPPFIFTVLYSRTVYSTCGPAFLMCRCRSSCK